MKGDKTLFLFIIFMIFIFFKRVFETIISIKYKDEMDNHSKFGEFLSSFRIMLSIIALIGTILFFVLFKLTPNMIYLLILCLFSNVWYFLWEYEYIYYFIHEQHFDKNIERFLDEELDITVNILTVILYFYLLSKIFPSIL